MRLEIDKILSIIRLSHKAFAKYRYQISILTVLGFISGLLEAIGVNALIPLFSFLLGGNEFEKDIITRTIEKVFVFFNIQVSVGTLLVFIVSMFLLKALVLMIVQYIKVKIASDYEENLRKKLFGNILKSNWHFLMKQKLGHLETVMMIDVPESANFLLQVSGAIMTLTGLLIYTFAALSISFPVTLTTLVFGGTIFIFFRPLAKKINTLSYQRIDVNKKTSHLIGQSITGIKTIKSLVSEDVLIKKGSEHFAYTKKIMTLFSFYKSIPVSILPAISVFFISILFVISYKTPYFNLASLVAIVYLINKIFSFIQQFQNALLITNGLTPFLRSTLDVEREGIQNFEHDTGNNSFLFKQKIEFKNITFGYSKGRTVLNDINLIINKGEFVGMVGPSGGGKTTLVDLLLRLLKPTKGSIFVDSENINNTQLTEWRSNVGYISQDIFMLNDSILENVRFYNPSISFDRIVEAVKMAQIYDFIQTLPDKFDTIVGEKGVFLSAGQRQRIAIARVLARKPEILVLDEATSALDNESESRIQQVIKNLKGSVTVIAIAHRLSTVMDSDRLIVIENGSVIEEGKPSDLIHNKDSYFFKVNQIASN